MNNTKILCADIEGTKEKVFLNSKTEEEENKCFKKINKVLTLVDSGLEPSMKNLDGNYITSPSNAKVYTELYGFQFVEMEIMEL